MSLTLQSSHPITEHKQPDHLSLTLKQAESSGKALEAIAWFKWISHLSNIKGFSFPEHLTTGFGLLTKRAAQVERTFSR